MFAVGVDVSNGRSMVAVLGARRKVIMKHTGLKVCYNVQTATDPESHMITPRLRSGIPVQF